MEVTLPKGYDLREGADPVSAHTYLTRSYWAEGISLETVRRSLDGSFAISVLWNRAQIAMARVISDFATFAYLADVYVLENHQGQGLGKAMLTYIDAQPRFQGLRRWALFTQDAQGFYAQFGWQQYPHPERMMTRDNRKVR